MEDFIDKILASPKHRKESLWIRKAQENNFNLMHGIRAKTDDMEEPKKKFKFPALRMPSEEELTKFSETWWAEQKDTSFYAWNDTLRALSFPLHTIPIPRDVVRKMLDVVDSGTGEGFPEIVKIFEALTDRILAEVGVPFFVKLISRSPKDYLAEYDKEKHEFINAGKPVGLNSVTEMLNALLSSMRTFDDLVLFSRLDVCALVIRPYENFEPLDEWRVLVKDGEILGISQYYYQELWDGRLNLQLVESWIRHFVDTKVTPEMPVKDFIADIVIGEPRDKWALVPKRRLYLLETNPWGKSDPCLFKSYDKLDGTLKINDGSPVEEDQSVTIEI